MSRPHLAVLAAFALATSTAVITPAYADAARPDTRQQAYSAAADEFDVPTDVLLAVSYLESRWEDHAGRPSRAGGYGPMHLTDVSAPHGAGKARSAGGVKPSDPSLHTVDLAARLTGEQSSALRTDPTANIRGGAAVLARYQRDLRLSKGSNSAPGAWYAAVAKYGGANNTSMAKSFANQVFAKVRDGVTRTTSGGARVSLAGTPDVQPRRGQLDRLKIRDATRAGGRVECPKRLGCLWVPAPYKQYGEESGEYGNHDRANRPRDLNIDQIVIHDTEETWANTLNLVQDPEYVSWQYTVRSKDGQIAQHVRHKDVAWHAGNWYANMHSIGIEHEGYETDGSWFTEAMYQNSATLVRYLAKKYNIPLDRAHIVGHDQVPAADSSGVKDMHHDPGPFWDWEHYFDLLKSPIASHGQSAGGVVTIKPGFDGNKRPVTGCGDDAEKLCAKQGMNFVYLHTKPKAKAPLVNDIGLRPDGSPNTTNVSDVGARAAAGAQYPYAGRKGDWTAVRYLGKRAWFHNPADAPTAVHGVGLLVEPKTSKDSIPFYGTAYPEKSAYPDDIPPEKVTPLQYSLPQGQAAVLADRSIQTDYYSATEYDVPGRDVVGKDKYYRVWMGHRMGYVRAADVDITPGV